MPNVMVSAVEGGDYSIHITKLKGAKFYHIMVPDWRTYTLPLSDFDKFRIYRSGLWHEACHSKYTPEQVYYYGAHDITDPNSITAPLEHDVINILEDRRIEDLGVKEWPGYVAERLFSNGYCWSQRMDVGEFWKFYLKQYFDPATNNFNLPTDPLALAKIRQRISKMRHEAFLQRLIVGKIKGSLELPLGEKEKIEDEAAYIEQELAKLGDDNSTEAFNKLAHLTQHAIHALELQFYKPTITHFGESSWDQTFTQTSDDKDRKDKTRQGIDDYFDELMTVEVICEKCGKTYTKRYGLRGEEGQKFKEQVEATGAK
jgi:hypothetical protein